jgi:hypothetical protein
VFEWKSPNSPEPKKASPVKSKVKSMIITVFDNKRIVHKEFVLAGQSVLHAIVTFYGDCMKMCKDFALNFGNERTGGCFTMNSHIHILFHQGFFLPNQHDCQSPLTLLTLLGPM